jgi:AcrR family transcriptional regulator
VGCDREQDEAGCGRNSERRPEESRHQPRGSHEEHECELVEPFFGYPDPGVGGHDIRAVRELAYRRERREVVSPQRSNRQQLIEGTLRCLDRLPAERITARAIAAESGANLASIAYHFGSKDALVTEAVVEGLDRWLDEIGTALGRLDAGSSEDSLRAAARVIEATRERHIGLARNFLGALSRAQHDSRIRALLTEGFRHSRRNVAAVLELGDDQVAEDVAGLLHSLFTGLLFQTLLDPDLAIERERMNCSLARLRAALPAE